MKRHFIMALALLLGTLSFYAPGADHKDAVWRGRVIDKSGKPVARAMVFAKLAVPVEGSYGYRTETDEEGVFLISWKSSPSPQQALLYVAAASRENAIAPIDLPFSDALRNANSAFAGLPVLIHRRNQELILGDIQPQVYYGILTLHLPESVLAHLSLDSFSCSDLWIRVRDLRGDLVSEEECISGRNINQTTHEVLITLPEGSWKIEVALGNKTNTWKPLHHPVTVSASGTQPPINLAMPADERPVQGVDWKITETRRAARVELSRRGIDFNTSTFLQKVEAVNIQAVQLFLAAGFNVNARRDDGNTALMIAVSRGYLEVVRALLNYGADVNAKNNINRGETALLLGAFSSSAPIVKALLDSGADVNATLDDGWTSLMLAAGAGQIDNVTLLINAGADVNAKSQDGMTAMIQAKYRPKMLELLKKAGAREY